MSEEDGIKSEKNGFLRWLVIKLRLERVAFAKRSALIQKDQHLKIICRWEYKGVNKTNSYWMVACIRTRCMIASLSKLYDFLYKNKSSRGDGGI